MSDEEKPPWEPTFEHDWQREAWNEEIATAKRRREERKLAEANDANAGVQILDLVSRLKPADDGVLVEPSRLPECAAEHCDRLAHYRVGECGVREVIRRCPILVRGEISARYDSERKRLRGVIEQMERLGGFGFAGYDVNRCEGGFDALRTMQEFAGGRPPSSGVFMAGTTGLGKTRLLVASHLELIKAGISSLYVTSPELRRAFDAQRSFDEETKEQAERFLERPIRAQVVHLDDLGDVEGDERKRGTFAEGLKAILDSSRAVWAAATNLTFDEAVKHPDVGAKIVSRLMQGATVIKLSGDDYRVSTARAPK